MLVDAVPSIINICGNLRKTGHHVEVRRSTFFETNTFSQSELVPGGHFLYFPYFPHHGIIYNAQINMLWGFGGECYQHSKSQETTWKKNVEFFKKHLGDVKRIPEWKRESTVTLPVSTKSSKSLQCKL